MKIILIDDDIFVTMSLKTILEAEQDIQVLATGTSGADAISLYQKYLPDILLMDIRMEGMSGLEATKEIIKQYPHAKILLLTTFLDDEYIVSAIQYGAKGYLLKQNFASIAPSLHAIYENQTVFGEDILAKLPSLLSKNSSHPNWEAYHLTEKEFQIIELLADGYNNKEIASTLYFSEGTVRNYISAILEKLELRDRTQIACFYYKYLH